MRRYFVPVIIFLLLASGFLVSGEQTGKIADNYPFETALELSRILDRQFIFSFVQDGCPNCERFKDNFLADPGIREVLNRHFVLSLVTTEETFKIDLPEHGEVTNMQLVSGLDVKVTPTTFIFYPPDPGLLKEGNAITRFSNNPPDPESLVELLERIATESFKEEEKEEDPTYYNYRPAVKEIGEKDFNFLKETLVEIPVLTEKVGLASIPDARELVVNFSGGSVKEYSRNIISETDVDKVYLVGG